MARPRLIPKLQLFASEIDSGELSVVNTVNFDRIIEIGSPVSQAKIYDAQLADELILVDITPSKSSVSGASDSDKLLHTLKSVAQEVFLPLTVGGGVRSLQHVAQFLSNGADKVCINSSVIARPQLITDVATSFGSQCVVVSIDYKKNSQGELEVFADGGRTPTGLSVVNWAKQAEELGAGEILLTCIDHDGIQQGLDVATGKLVGDVLTVPLILSGGCGLASHFVDGFSEAGADAIAAGTFFSFRDQNPMQARGHIKNAGFNIRTGG